MCNRVNINSKKWFKTAVTLFVFAIAISQILEQSLVWNYQEGSLSSTMIIYGVVRTLNAGLSMLQGTVMTLSMGGGVQIAVGELLDPLNDLIERFSWVVMMAIASLGIQKILLTIVASKTANLLLGVAVLGYLSTVWIKPLIRYQHVSLKTISVLFFVRFSLSSVFLCNYALDIYYFDEEKSKAQQELIETNNVVKSNTEFLSSNSDISEDSGFFDKMKRTYSETKDNLLNAGSKVSNVSDRVEGAISSVMDLIAFYILQTVLLPVAFLFLFYKGLMGLVNKQFKPIERDEEVKKLEQTVECEA